MSGTEFGKTLGSPIGLFVPNEDMRPGDYADMRAIPRPSHADFTYMVPLTIYTSALHLHPLTFLSYNYWVS